MSSKRVVDEDEIRKSVCLNGDPASSIGKILYELYITRLTATRAAYLEEINAAALAQGAGSVTSNAQVDSLVRAVADIVRSGGSGDLAAILADVTGINGSAMLTAANVWETNISAYSGAGYAGTYLKTLYDDWLNGGRLDLLIDSIITYVDCLPASMGDIVTKNLAHILSDSTAFAGADIATIKGLVDSAEATGPFSYLDAGGEQTVKEDTAVTRRHIYLEVSNRNMAQTGTFKIYRKVDGSNYDLYTSQAVKVAAGSDRAWDAEFTTNQAWKVTYTEDADEAAAKNIPYNVITQVIE